METSEIVIRSRIVPSGQMWVPNVNVSKGLYAFGHIVRPNHRSRIHVAVHPKIVPSKTKGNFNGKRTLSLRACNEDPKRQQRLYRNVRKTTKKQHRELSSAQRQLKTSDLPLYCRSDQTRLVPPADPRFAPTQAALSRNVTRNQGLARSRNA